MILIYFVLFWNSIANDSEILQETSMECPLYDFLISVRLDNTPGRHGQFLILIVCNLINRLLWNYEAQWIVGMMHGRSCTKCLYFKPIVQLMWRSYAVLVCDCPKKSSLKSFVVFIIRKSVRRISKMWMLFAKCRALPFVEPLSYSYIRRNNFVAHVISDQLMLPLNEAHWHELWRRRR